MNTALIKSLKITALGCTFALLAACVDLEEQERQEQNALAAKSCAELSIVAAEKKAGIAEQTRKATTSSLAAAFGSGSKAETARLNATLAQTIRTDLQKELHQVELLMARKGCS